MWSAIFPGQGSQFVGMSQFLFDNFSFVRERFEEASDCLKLNFKRLCFIGPEEELTQTANTQPALLLSSVVTHEVVRQTTEIQFQSAAGHSVGEYAALVTGGVLNFSQALRAVRRRGELMQSAVPQGQGAMLAVMGWEDDDVRRFCQWAEKEADLFPLEPANFNSPGQVVISGSARLVEWVQENGSRFDLSPRRVKFIPLKVSAPFHCSLMKPAEEKMALVLEEIEFCDSQYPIVQNYTATPTTNASQLRNYLIAQISAPVLWVDCVKKLRELGARKYLELGPGKTLSGLIKKIDNQALKTFNVSSLEDLKKLEKER